MSPKMSPQTEENTVKYDFVVIGGGPAGMKAGVQASKEGKRVLMIDRAPGMGGECVRRGTIPSKTLRETANCMAMIKRRSSGLVANEMGEQVKVEALMRRLREVLHGHESFMGAQIARNAIDMMQGKASFTGPKSLYVEMRRGVERYVEAEHIVIATGSRPRCPDHIDVDHETVLDSDSILSMIYLPSSLVVLGAGVIACEFASVFQTLGTKVTMIDSHPSPLGFMDGDLTEGFVKAFERDGGTFLPNAKVVSSKPDAEGHVLTTLESGEVIQSEKCLCAQGRTASTRGLNLEAAGLELSKRGHVPVDENCQTQVKSIYAVGDVIGPPALAASAMDQGRRAARHALNLDLDMKTALVPCGIYTLPELASVGETEAQVTERLGSCTVSKARFDELARGHISGNTDGFLKLVCDAEGKQVLGVHVMGEGAAELVSIAQMAIYAAMDVDAFVENIFNFPTMAEAYRVAAIGILAQRASLRRAA